MTMTKTNSSNVVFGPQLQIETVIQRFGAWRVLTVAMLTLVRVRQARPPNSRAKDLPDYLREDVGLPASPTDLRIYTLNF